MSKYDKMIEENQRKSKEKIELALQAIQDMLANKERISVPKLMKKTGLSRGFFYKNPTVRDTLNQAVEQQAGMIDPRREILNMAMEKQIELLNQKVAALSRENKEYSFWRYSENILIIVNSPCTVPIASYCRFI